MSRDKKIIKQNQNINNVIRYVLKLNHIKVDVELIKEVKELYYDKDTLIIESEFFVLLHSILFELFASVKKEYKLSDYDLKKIIYTLDNSLKKSINTSPHSLAINFSNSIKNVKKQILKNSSLNDDEIFNLITVETNKKVIALGKVSESYISKPYKLFMPYLEKIVLHLKKIDVFICDETLQKYLLEIKEIYKFYKFLDTFTKQNQLSQTLPQIVKNQILLNRVNLKLLDNSKILLKVLDAIVGRADEYIWHQSKNSKKIINYLKINIPNKIVGSKNFLYFIGEIDVAQMQSYNQIEKNTLLILSNEVKIVEFIKSSLEKIDEKIHFGAFTSIEQSELWLKHHAPQKIIIEYKFKDKSSNNALEVLRLLVKKYSQIYRLVRKSKVLIAISKNEMSDYSENRGNFDFRMVEKPLNKEQIIDRFLYT